MSDKRVYFYDFFLAHAGSDRSAAEALYDLLSQDAGVFLDSRRLKLGDDWDTELIKAQRHSRITVVLVSSQTDVAYYQREEIAFAIDMARRDEHRVVPVYLDEWPGAQSTVPYGLRLKHGLCLSEAGGFSGVARRLRELLSQLNDEAAAAPKGEEPLADAAVTKPANNESQSSGTRPAGGNAATIARGRLEYFCYVSHNKLDQLVGELGDRDVAANDSLVQVLPQIRQIVSADVSYGRPDVLQRQGELKREYVGKLKRVLTVYGEDIVPFDWSLPKTSAGSNFFWLQAPFRVRKVDGEIAEIATVKGRTELVLHCSLQYFSEDLSKGRVGFHSTNYAFFERKLDVNFETVFYLISAKGRKFFGSPLYLKLSPITGLLL